MFCKSRAQTILSIIHTLSVVTSLEAIKLFIFFIFFQMKQKEMPVKVVNLANWVSNKLQHTSLILSVA